MEELYLANTMYSWSFWLGKIDDQTEPLTSEVLGEGYVSVYVSKA